jgi:hypothetical protein
MNSDGWSLSPRPGELIRALAEGMSYRLDAAFADIIDNSISAGATEISINVEGATLDTACVTILDNGSGMSHSDLMRAIQFGDIERPRSDRDLGQYGLGMKLASLSVCNCVTIISKQNGAVCGVTVDLENLPMDAVVPPLAQAQLAATGFSNELHSLRSGTMIIWRRLKAFRTIEALNAGVIGATRELALTFHRFLNPGLRESRLIITVGGSRLEHRDPFLRDHDQTENLREARVDIGDGAVARLSGTILPPIRRITQEDQLQATGGKTFLETSGVYVYRSRRLIQYGDWLGIIPRRKMIGLARVALDLDQKADGKLCVDVTKTRLRLPLPEPLLSRLKDYIEPIKRRATSAFLNIPRNHKLERAESDLWIRSVAMNEIRYYLNDEHPLMTAIKNHGADPEILDQLLRAIEYSLPVAHIYTDMQGLGTQRVSTGNFDTERADELFLIAKAILSALVPMLDPREAIERLCHMQPFLNDPETTKTVLTKLRQELP